MGDRGVTESSNNIDAKNCKVYIVVQVYQVVNKVAILIILEFHMC